MAMQLQCKLEEVSPSKFQIKVELEVASPSLPVKLAVIGNLNVEAGAKESSSPCYIRNDWVFNIQASLLY